MSNANVFWMHHPAGRAAYRFEPLENGKVLITCHSSAGARRYSRAYPLQAARDFYRHLRDEAGFVAG